MVKQWERQSLHVQLLDFSEQSGQKQSSRTNRMAKQFLRALSVFSVMSLAEGARSPIKSISSSLSGTVQHVQSMFMDPLGQWHVFASLFICVMVSVFFVNPGSSRAGVNDDEERGVEPSPEPMVSRPEPPLQTTV